MIKAVAALSVLALASPAAATSSAGGPGVAFARVDLNPSAVAVYPAKNTIYSANNARNDISIVNGANCDAANTGGCSQLPPRQDVGVQPNALAVNQRTSTVYVANFSNAAHGTVSIVNALTCNATDTAHCTQFPHLPPAVRLPFDPSDIAINERTNTIYVDGAGNQLAIIDGRNCNGTRSTGCRHAVHVTRVAAGAGGVAVNPRTNTLYVVSYFTGLVSVISGRTCEAGNVSGCSHRRATVRVGRHPFRLTVDAATNTVYVTNFGARTVSVISAGSCNAKTVAGCGKRPASIRVGREPESVAIDDSRHLAFVTNAADDTVSIFDTRSCNGTKTSGCKRPPATLKVGSLPAGIAINPRTQTVYVANNASDTLALFNAALPKAQ